MLPGDVYNGYDTNVDHLGYQIFFFFSLFLCVHITSKKKKKVYRMNSLTDLIWRFRIWLSPKAEGIRVWSTKLQSSCSSFNASLCASTPSMQRSQSWTLDRVKRLSSSEIPVLDSNVFLLFIILPIYIFLKGHTGQGSDEVLLRLLKVLCSWKTIIPQRFYNSW